MDRFRRFVCAVLAFVFVLAAPFLFMPAEAITTPQTLKVYAQYWGDPDSAVLLGEYTREELEALSYTAEFGYEGNYNNVTRVHTVMRVHARGVKLEEFLRDKVGVDLNSVRQLDFHTTDVDADARFVSKGRQELLDDPHYYYPNLVANSHYDGETDSLVVDDEEAARSGAMEVPTIIAVVQYATKNPQDDMSEEMTAEDTFRLCAGSPDLLTVTSFESARWVDEIYVVLAGAPPEEPSSEEPSSESPTKGGNDQKPSENPTQAPTQPRPGTTAQPKTRGSAIRTTTRRTTRVYPYNRSTTRTTTRRTLTVTSSTTRQFIANQSTTAVNSGNMGQLVVNGYDSMIQWKEDSPDNVEALRKPVVTTKGARNAALLFLVSFAAGALMMYRWFIKEK